MLNSNGMNNKESKDLQIERICLSPNSDCNLGCRYCYFYNPQRELKHEPKLTSKEIYSIITKVVDYAEKRKLLKPIKINFVGSGEPLLAWREIRDALSMFKEVDQDSRLKFYTVTNGTLLNQKMVEEMKELKVKPTISIDGPPIIHNENRIYRNGQPTLNQTLKGLQLLKDNGFEVEINTTITPTLVSHLNEYFDFLAIHKIEKVVFDRLVDTPINFPKMTYADYYQTLEKILAKWDSEKIRIEIGNFESFFKSFQGRPDQVCTMFGSSCGAGLTNLMYMQREVYPCGRMFDQPFWKLGQFTDSLFDLQSMMKEKLIILDQKNIVYHNNQSMCNKCEIQSWCVADCLIEKKNKSERFDCSPRKNFLRSLWKVYDRRKLS